MSLYDDASLIMIPSGVKAGKVYSQKPMDSDGQFTFTRASEASRVNSAGLIEKVRTNLFTESNNFSDSDWNVKSGTFTQGVEDPNGGNDAWSWTSTNTDPFLYQSGKSVSGVGTLSIWVKGVGSTIGKNFELRNASIPYKNVVLTGEWQRVEHFNSTVSGTSVGFEYGNPAVLGDVVHIYQAQYEYGTVATDYIDTTTVVVSEGPVANVPRLDYSGGATCPSLLLEPSRTNSLTHSEAFSEWTDEAATVTINDTTSPDGYTNADKLVATSSVERQALRLPNSSTGALAYSVYAKKGEYSVIQLTDSENGSMYANFDLDAGALGSYEQTTPIIESVGSGWYRCSMNYTCSGASVNYMRISIAESPTQARLVTFAGNGSDGVYIYGAQLEAGSYSTSLISTYGTAATRVDDNLSILSMSSGVTSGATAATLVIELEATQAAVGDAIAFGQDNGGSPTGRGYLYTRNLGFADTWGSSGLSVTDGVNAKIIYRLNTLSSGSIFKDGVKGTDQSGTAWAAIGSLRFRGAYNTFKIKQILLFNEALTDAKCIELTTL